MTDQSVLTSEKAERRMIEALTNDYATGAIDIAEFERRADRIIHDDPTPVDALRDRERARNEFMIESYKRGCMVFGA